MKKLTVILTAVALLFVGTNANAQLLQSLLNAAAGTVYSAPISLNGTYVYNGVAVSVSSSEGGVVQNLAGSAVTAGIETKIDQYLAKVGLQPGAFTFVFTPGADNAQGQFVCYVKSFPISGTYTVGQAEKTITLQFGKVMQFMTMTGDLESSLTGANMVFPSNKLLAFFKKVVSVLGKSTDSLSAITSFGEGYDNMKIGFKLAKQ